MNPEKINQASEGAASAEADWTCGGFDTTMLERFARGESVPEEAAAHFARCDACRSAASEIGANNTFLAHHLLEMQQIRAASPVPSQCTAGYRLEGEIARGAQGIVYRAVQERTNRVVAIKVLREGLLGSSKARLRFEREVEIVAGLNHPNIVTLHHALTVGGSQALVMEYVDGIPLTQWTSTHGRSAAALLVRGQAQPLADARRPISAGGRDDLRARLVLFVKICDAVAHAHQHGVIHRDLKPSNILVDTAGEPRLLDFGIAKPLAETDAALPTRAAAAVPWENTQIGEFAGTLAYASPEQVSGDPRQIGTGCDIYSLGVVLFEFLTGLMPYSVEGTMLDVARRIESAPPRRASSVRDAVDSEIDAILLTALEKDPTRRYASALAMKEEIERYLAGLPLHAKRTHTGYVLRKWMWRHKAVVIGLCTLVGTLITATAVSSSLMLRASAAKVRAETSLDLAERLADEREREAYAGSIGAAQEALAALDSTGLASRLFETPVHLRGWEFSYLHAREHPPGALLERSQINLTDGDLSADRPWAATSGDDGIIDVWNTVTLRRVHSWKASDTPVNRVALSPDGEFIAFAVESTKGKVHPASVKLMHRSDGKLVTHELDHPDSISDVDFVPGTPWIATSCRDGSIRIWNWHDGILYRRFVDARSSFAPATQEARAVAVSRDGTRVVGAVAQGWIVMWNVESGARMWRRRIDDRGVEAILGSNPPPVLSVAISDDGRVVASGYRNSRAYLWDADTGASLGILAGHRGNVTNLQFLPGPPGTRRLLSASSDSVVRLWDCETRTLLHQYFGPRTGVVSLACSQDGKTFLAIHHNADPQMWETDWRSDPPVLSHSEQPVRGVAISRDSREATTVADDFLIRSWSLRTSSQARALDIASQPKTEVTNLSDRLSLSFQGIGSSPTADLVLTTHRAGQICFWNPGAAKPEVMPSSVFLLSEACGPTFTNDGRTLIVSHYLKGATVWDVKSRTQITHFSIHGDTFRSATISPDGRYIALLRRDGVLTIRDGATFEVVADLQAAQPWYLPVLVPVMSFSPDSTRLAVPSGDKVKVFDVPNHKELFTCVGHSDAVNAVRFSPDGTRIVSASQDTTVRLWDAETGQRRLVLRGHQQGVNDAVFTPDGSVIVSCGQDGNALVWDSQMR